MIGDDLRDNYRVNYSGYRSLIRMNRIDNLIELLDGCI